MSYRVKTRLQYSAAPLAMLLASAVPALAQNAPGALEEIVVTAQRREEKLQDVPVSVSAFSADAIEQRGLTNVMALNSLAPNVSITNAAGNSTAAQIGIRGGIQINPALSWDPAVGIYLDGVYIGKTQGSVFDIADLSRIEVLRGPQGTLYGRNTLSGALNLVTRAPSGEFKGWASVGYGNYDYKVGKFALDLPRFGMVSASVSGRIERRDGFVRNVATPGFANTVARTPKLNNLRSEGGRIAVDFDPTDDINIAYRYDYSNNNQSNQFYQMTSVGTVPQFGTATTIFDPNSPAYAGIPLNLFVNPNYSETASIDGPAYERSQVQGHSITGTWNASDALSLKSITAYRKLTWKDGLDLDGSPLPIAHTQRLSDYWAWSQEAQAFGKLLDEKLNYVAGFYFFKDDGFTYNPQSYFFGTNFFDSSYGFTSKVYAFYTQVDYKVLDDLTATAGVRYSHERKTILRTLVGTFNFAPPVTLIPTTTNAATFNSTTPMASLTYRFSDGINLYARYSQGYKSGGFNGETNTAAELNTPYRPEKMDAYEIGSKITFLEGRGTFNAALFLNKSSDLQLSIFKATGAASSTVENAGKGTARGLELEGSLRVLDGWTVGMNYGYLNTYYSQYLDSGVNVAADRPFLHSPKHTFSVNLDARLYQSDNGTLRLITDYAYQSSQFFYPYSLTRTTNPNAFYTQVPGYGIVNAKLLLADIPVSGDVTGEVAFWMKNIADNRAVQNWIDFGPGFGNIRPTNFVNPRTFGAELKVRW
ncbi:MAG: TonB-dependent receptor [Rhodospirillaceae bacterium]|nr:TonB-dependent receptor [Rhodospirillaceae bacterium]